MKHESTEKKVRSHSKEKSSVPKDKVGSYTKSKLEETLTIHGVSSAMVNEINDMATSYIPREAIVQHVQSHFPNKREHEWNDIVIAAVGVAGRRQPEVTDMQKSNRDNAEQQKKKFKSAKAVLDKLIP